MITLPEMTAGIRGAFRLARRDPGGLALFDASPRGFWNSFWAAVLLAPAFVITDFLAGSLSSESGPREILIALIGYVIDWTAFPVVMITIADSLGKWPLYTRYIVAYNWSAVVQMSALLPISLLAVTFPGHATLILAQCVIIILLIYRAYVAYVALAVNLGTAMGIVLLDVLLSALSRAVSNRLLGI